MGTGLETVGVLGRKVTALDEQPQDLDEAVRYGVRVAGDWDQVRIRRGGRVVASVSQSGAVWQESTITMKGLLAMVVRGEAVTDEQVKHLAYAIENYDFTVGDGSQPWHTCTMEELPAYRAAHSSLQERLTKIEAAQEKPLDEEAVHLSFEIADLESRAQDAEDREQLKKASEFRAKARDLKTKLNARVATAKGA